MAGGERREPLTLPLPAQGPEGAGEGEELSSPYSYLTPAPHFCPSTWYGGNPPSMPPKASQVMWGFFVSLFFGVHGVFVCFKKRKQQPTALCISLSLSKARVMVPRPTGKAHLRSPLRHKEESWPFEKTHIKLLNGVVSAS